MASQEQRDAAGRAAYQQASARPAATRKRVVAKRPAGKRPAGAPRKGKKSVSRKRPGWLKFLRILFFLLSLATAVALCVTAYAGNMSPVLNSGIWGILPLCFAPAAAAAVAMLLIQLGWNRPGWLVVALGMVISAGPLLSLCPLHIFSPSVPKNSEPLTVLTYNVHNFNLNAETSGRDISRYILEQNADVVCLQESSSEFWSYVPKALRDSIHKEYPYIFHGGYAQTTLSKYPLKPIHINLNRSTFGGGDVAIYHLSMPDGRIVTLFNVHLESYELNGEDREIFKNLTEMKPEDPSEVRRHLLDKLLRASRERASQARQLTRYVRLYGGPNVIIAGDFNDVPDCYTIRMLENECGFSDVYPKVGFGPMVTYNQSRFYFCIDHLMYRGALKPISLKKGSLKASDHYPLMVTFALKEQKVIKE